MMHRRGFGRFLLIVLVVLAFVAVLGSARQRTAWMEGYAMGQAAADGNSIPMPYGGGFGGMHGGWIMPVLLILALMLGLGLFAVPLMMFVGGRHWMRSWGVDSKARSKRFRRHWAKSHGDRPPWFCDEDDEEEDTPEEKPEDEPR